MVKTGGVRKAVVVGIDDYEGTLDDLPSCVADATTVGGLLRSTFGFSDVVTLVDSEATWEAVTRALGRALTDVTPDDRVVFYYSGHGTQTVRGDELRESLCLYDRLLYDEVLVEATLALPPGVLTIVLDSCFSGGMAKLRDRAAKIKSKVVVNKAKLERPQRYRPFGSGSRMNFGPITAANTKFIAAKLHDETGPRLNALLISACLENETAAASTAETEGLSAFTFGMRGALAELGTTVSVSDLFQRAVEILRSIQIVQSPQLHPPEAAAMEQLTLFLANAPFSAALSSPLPFGDGLLERVMQAAVKALLATAH